MDEPQNVFVSELCNLAGLIDITRKFSNQLQEDYDRDYAIQLQEELDREYATELLEEEELISSSLKRKHPTVPVESFASDCDIVDERKSKLEPEVNLLDYELVLVDDGNVDNDHDHNYELVLVDDDNVNVGDDHDYNYELVFVDNNFRDDHGYDYILDDDTGDTENLLENTDAGNADNFTYLDYSYDIVNDRNIDDQDHISQ